MKTTIEINGRIYDAQTGKMLSAPKSDTPNKPATTPTSTRVSSSYASKPLKRGVVMDGVSRKPIQPSNRATTSRKPAVKTVQKSQTLNRKAVKKPTNSKPVPYVHSTSANVTSRVEQSATGRGMLLKRVPDARLGRAIAASKSNLVSRFTKTSPEKPKLTTDLAVKPAPHTKVSKANIDEQVAKAPEIKTVTHPLEKKQTDPVQTKKFVFEDRIKHANSHLLKPVKKESRRKKLLRSLKVSPKVLSAAAAVFAVVLLAGFFAYQNVPVVSMRVAASKAGFEGKLPKNIPAGYAFSGPVKAEQGTISLIYDSNSDARKFTVTQKPTNWSSEALLTNFLLDSNFRYQAYKDKGLTVYIYNGSNATWVDKGVWFSISGDEGSLSSEQLLEVASSI